MAIASFAILIVGVLLALWGLACYREARKWARECKGIQIAIAYKNRVKMSPNLEELILWGRKAKGGGQVFYGMGGTRIAVINRVGVSDSKVKQDIGPSKQVRQGTWSATDETEKAQV